MTKKPCIPRAFCREQNAALAGGEPQAYGASEAVREWLVLLALSGSALERPAELERATAVALGNVCDDISHDLLLMDYQPFDPQTLDIPPIDHPQYMQALLYWRCELGWTLPRLAEAHAQLGSHPRVWAVRAAMRRMGREDAQDRTQAASTQRPADVAATTTKVSPVCEGTQSLLAHGFTRGLRHGAKLRSVATSIGHLMRNDQVVFGIHSYLYVVSHHA